MDQPTPIPADAISGKKLVPALTVGCLVFGVAMSLISYWFWVATKDFFIERAAQEAKNQPARSAPQSAPQNPPRETETP